MGALYWIVSSKWWLQLFFLVFSSNMIYYLELFLSSNGSPLRSMGKRVFGGRVGVKYWLRKSSR